MNLLKPVNNNNDDKSYDDNQQCARHNHNS